MRILATSLLLLLATGTGRAQQLTDDQLAARFMPSRFDKFVVDNPGVDDDRSWTVARVDLDNTGQARYAGIAYGNGHIALLRVIRLAPQPTLVGEAAAATACDFQPSLTAIDLDGDQRPELVMQCTVGNSGNKFASIFHWTGTTLSVLNPANPRRENAWSPILDPDFADLEGNGVLDVLEPAEDRAANGASPSLSFNVYRLRNGTLTKTALHAAYLGLFTRGSGQPETVTEQFTTAPGQYQLVIANGEHGQNMVDSGVVVLNGKTVVTPDSFEQPVRVIKLPISVSDSQNTIAVQLRSKPGSLLRVALLSGDVTATAAPKKKLTK